MSCVESLEHYITSEVIARWRPSPVRVCPQDNDLCHVGVLSEGCVVGCKVDGFVTVGRGPGRSTELATSQKKLIVREECLSAYSDKLCSRVSHLMSRGSTDF